MKRNKILVCATTWINLEKELVTEVNILYDFHLYKMSKIDKSIYRKNILVVT